MGALLRGVVAPSAGCGARAATPAAAACAAASTYAAPSRAARLHNWHARVATAASTAAPAVLPPQPWQQRPWRQQPRCAAAAPTAAAAAAAAAGPSAPAAVAPPPPPLVDYLDFELLWLRSRSKYALSNDTALWALEDARAGRVPCDAAAMCARVEAFLELGRRLPGVDPRPLLNRHRLALRQDPGELVAPARQLLRMLPAYPPTPLLQTALSELPRRPPEALALAISSLAPAVRGALGGSLTGPLLTQVLAACDDDDAASAAGFFGAAAAAPWVGERLKQLADLLGPELAYSALTSAPELIRLEPSEAAVRIAALADLLGRPPVEVALVAGRQPALLLTPPGRVAAAGDALAERFAGWLGWRRHRALHFLAWNPAVLAAAAAAPGDGGGGGPAVAAEESSSGQGSSSRSGEQSSGGGGSAGDVPAGVWLMEQYWKEAAALAAARPSWRAAVSLGRYPTVAAILCGNTGAGGGDPESPGGGGGGDDDATGGFGADGQGIEDGAAAAAATGEAAAAAGASRFSAWRDSQEQRLQRLRYCAASGDLPRLGLRRALLTHPVAFLSRCPGYRAWRLRQAGGGAADGGAGGMDALPRWWGEPQLEVLGELGPYDRL